MKKKTSPYRYAIGLFALTLITQLFHGFSYNYYVEIESLITINLATIAKVIFVIVDGVDDVLLGALSEKTKSKWGKRLPWLVFTMPWLALSVILTYVVNSQTNFSVAQFFAYYLIISILFENFSTIMYINYGSLYPVLFQKESERAEVSSLKHFGELLGMGICLVCTWFFVEKIGYVAVGCIYGLVYMIIMTICITGIHYDKSKDNQGKKPYSFIQTIKDVVHNKPFLIYNIAVSFNLSVMGVLVTIYPIYAKHVLGVSGTNLSILVGTLFLVIVISVRIWYSLIRKYGHRNCWKFSYIAFPFIIAALGIPTSFVGGLITVICIGPFIGGILITPDLMSAELIDIDKRKHGVSREASFLSIGTLMQRISVAISAIFMSVVTSLFGYVNGANPGPNPQKAFRIITGCMLPVIALLGMIFAIIYIKISQKDYEEVESYRKQHNDKLFETREIRKADIEATSLDDNSHI